MAETTVVTVVAVSLSLRELQAIEAALDGEEGVANARALKKVRVAIENITPPPYLAHPRQRGY